MGSILGSPMREMTQENQRFMLETQKMQMERQIQMQNQMRERGAAMQIASAREMFNWWASFYGLATVAAIAGFVKSKNPAAIVPLLPLTFIVGYQYDLSYHTKLQRIRDEANVILDKESDLLLLPHGLPTLESIEEARLKLKKQ